MGRNSDDCGVEWILLELWSPAASLEDPGSSVFGGCARGDGKYQVDQLFFAEVSFPIVDQEEGDGGVGSRPLIAVHSR